MLLLLGVARLSINIYGIGMQGFILNCYSFMFLPTTRKALLNKLTEIATGRNIYLAIQIASVPHY